MRRLDRKLRKAIWAADFAQAHRLVRLGADINAVDPAWGETLFVAACTVALPLALDFLDPALPAPADPGRASETRGSSPLFEAMFAKDFVSATCLLKHGANPNMICFTEDNPPSTALDEVYDAHYDTYDGVPGHEEVLAGLEKLLRSWGAKTYWELSNPVGDGSEEGGVP